MLGDLVCMEEAASAVERERVTQELEASPELRRWLDAVAPGLVDRALVRSGVEDAEHEDERQEPAAQQLRS